MTYVTHDESEFVPPMEVEEPELYHPKTFIRQSTSGARTHKVIAIQYAVTAIAVGLVALVLSGLMRLQLGLPHDVLASSRPATYFQFVTMHGMIMVIYLLTALFLGGFGNYLIPLMVRRARHGVPVRQHGRATGSTCSRCWCCSRASSCRAGPTGAGWTLYPPQAILARHAGRATGASS